MEASFKDRSSRLDASAQASDRRRHLKSSESGRRRRLPSTDMPDHSGDGSRNNGSRTRILMDNSSIAFAAGGSGGSHRRTEGRRSPNSNLQQSSSTIGNSGLDLSTQSHSYAQKYKAAQALFEEHHHNKQKMSRRQQTRRRSSCGEGGDIHSPSLGEERLSKSQSPSAKKGTRALTDKYKSIGRVGGKRRQSMDSAIKTDNSNTSNDPSFKSSMGERRARGVPPSNTSNSKKAEKSLTAARLKKVFAADAPATPGHHGKSPDRGVRRTNSLHDNNNATASRGPPARRMVERRPSATGDFTNSRRSSLPSKNGTGSEDRRHHHHHHRRHTARHTGTADLASRTTWKTPKQKAKASIEHIEAMLDSSMPSLTALDLSIHAGKRASKNSYISSTTTDDGFTPTPSNYSNNASKQQRPFALPKAPSISLLVDNAQSHASTTRTNKNNNKEGELDETSTICDSVDDIYHSAVGSVDSADPSLIHTDVSSKSENNQGSSARMLTDLSRSDASGNRPTGGRRRAKSHEDTAVPSRRKRSPNAKRQHRSRSRGANKNRTGINRNLRSQSGERKTPRRKSVAGLVSREDMNEVGHCSNPSLGRAHTTTAAPRRQKSINSLQRRHASESPTPRRQKSVSSLRSAGFKNSATANPAPRRKSKKKKAKSMLSESLGELETMWVRGSSAEGEYELQVAASAALEQTLAENGNSKQQSNQNIRRRKSCAASVGSSSMDSGNSRRSSTSGGRRRLSPKSMSSDSASLASSQDGSAAGKRKDRMRRSLSAKEVPDQRGSDATWSLADIDLGDQGSKKVDPDASVVTPPTVSSSSAEFETPRRRRKSAGRSLSPNYGGNGRRQESQKSLSSTAQKVDIRKEPQDFPGVPELMGRQIKDAFNLSSDQLNVFSNSGKGGAFKRNGKHAKNGHGEADNVGAFQTKNGRNGSFQTNNADRVDPFQNQHEQTDEEEKDPESSLHDAFASKDPFGLSNKPTQAKTGLTLGQPKPSEDMTDESFHMTNDFGDFGHESFGSGSFDNSQDFAVVPADKATAKSLLG